MTEATTEPIGAIDLPLVRLSLAKPIVEEVERRGVAVHDVLDDLSLSRDAIFSAELFVPAPVMYALLEALVSSQVLAPVRSRRAFRRIVEGIRNLATIVLIKFRER